jgi:hypothetical protein
MKLLLKIFVLLFLCFGVFAQTKTTVSGTFYLIDGKTPFVGSVRIINIPFITADGYSIPAQTQIFTIAAGTYSISLNPTDDAATPNVAYNLIFISSVSGTVAPLPRVWWVPISLKTVSESVVLQIPPLLRIWTTLGNPYGSTVSGTYTLPIAGANLLGGVKIGANITAAPDGTISVSPPTSPSVPYVLPATSPIALGGVIATPNPGNQFVSGIDGLGNLIYSPIPLSTTARIFSVTFMGNVPGTVGYIMVPFSCNMSNWWLLGGPGGNASVDVWYTTGAYPTLVNSIVGNSPPANTTGLPTTGTTSGWITTAYQANSILGINLVSQTNVVGTINFQLECDQQAQ